MIPVIQGVSSVAGTILGFGSNLALTAVENVFIALLSNLPDGGKLPQGVHDAAVYFGNTLVKMNFILPVDTLTTCLVIIIGVKIALWGLHFSFMIMNWIRGVPTSPFDGNMLPEDGPGQRYVMHKGNKIYL